jgi:exopolysaccharide biosynthesis polyprenyl glycosylphosphotransferase
MSVLTESFQGRVDFSGPGATVRCGEGSGRRRLLQEVRRRASRVSSDGTTEAAVRVRPAISRPGSRAAVAGPAVDDRTRAILDYRQRSIFPLRRGWLLHRSLMLADLVGLLVSFFIASALTSSTGPTLTDAQEAMLLVLSLPLWIVLMKLYGLYDRDEERADHSTVNEIIDVFHVLTVGTWAFFVFAETTDVVTLPLDRLVIFWLSAILAIPAIRAVTRGLCRRSLAYAQNAVIVGTGPVAMLVARKLLGHPEYGINLVGFIDGTPIARSESLGGVPVLGSPDDLAELASDLDIERVIVAFTPDSHDYTLDVIRTVRDLDIQVDIVPRLFEVVGTNSTVHTVEGIPLLGLPPLRLSPSDRFLKRALDLALASLGLLLLAPLFLVVAAAIKLDSRGPVFFRQLRRGGGGRTFWIYKFRTMSLDADSRKADVVHLNMHADDDPRMFKVSADPRVTRVGALLRRTSIDEIPQLLNVLRGHMSLVGPRPLILEEDRHVESWARKRLELKPGMTGLWQVLGRSDIPFDEMTKLDYLYVTNWSLTEDLRLILLTLPALFRPRRAY